MAERLADLQTRFAAHLRDPDGAPAPADVEDRRLEIYRDLFFRNISGFIARSFPVLRRLHDEQEWSALIRDFYRRHRCRTPFFPEIPREFLQYLQERERGLLETDTPQPPWLLQLAHYEWVEIALDLDAADPGTVPADPEGDLLTGTPVLSPLAWPLNYDWPVHRIRPGQLPEQPEATHLLAYRNRSDQVRFMQLNRVAARTLEALQEDPARTGLDLIGIVATELGLADEAGIVEAGRELLENLRRRDVVLGTRP